MRLSIITLILVLFFQGCSFKSVKNQWEFNSSSAFNSYMKNFLIYEDDLAQSELQRAIKYAKQSANLEQLSRIYLGACALNKSVEQDFMCKEYKEVEELINSQELKTYYLMLENEVLKEQIGNLPKQYKTFAKYITLKEYDLAFKAIKSMNQDSSKFIAASLIKKELKKEEVNFLINEASFLGYKKIVLFWLKHYYHLENNLKKREKIAKKIKILTPNQL